MTQFILSAASRSAGSQAAGGALRFILFLTVLLLIFWCIGIHRHMKAGWTKGQKILDIAGALMLLAAIILMAIPLTKL